MLSLFAAKTTSPSLKLGVRIFQNVARFKTKRERHPLLYELLLFLLVLRERLSSAFVYLSVLIALVIPSNYLVIRKIASLNKVEVGR